MAENVKEVSDSILKQVKSTMFNLLDGKIDLLKVDLKGDLGAEIWDKAVLEIGKATGLPPEIISKLQQIDNLLNLSKGEFTNKYNELKDKYDEYLRRISDEDLNKTVTISIKELNWIRIKSGLIWGSICFLFGYFFAV
jgi:hypothetical protein